MPFAGMNVGAMAPAAGGGSPTVSLAGGVSASTEADPDDSYSYFKFKRDGTIERAQGPTGTFSYFDDWCSAPSATVGDSFEIITDVEASGPGATSQITLSYQTMNTDFIMGHVDNGPAGIARTWAGNITIREIANTANNDTGAYSTSAEVV